MKDTVEAFLAVYDKMNVHRAAALFFTALIVSLVPSSWMEGAGIAAEYIEARPMVVAVLIVGSVFFGLYALIVQLFGHEPGTWRYHRRLATRMNDLSPDERYILKAVVERAERWLTVDGRHLGAANGLSASGVLRRDKTIDGPRGDAHGFLVDDWCYDYMRRNPKLLV